MKLFHRFVLMLVIIMAVVLPTFTAHAYNMPYYIDVDLSNNIVTVYSDEDDSIVRQMICSSGTYVAPSPTGVYFMPEKFKEMERTEWYTFQDGYGKYGTRIWYNYLFHSYLFEQPDDSTLKEETYAALGTSASHGCIRLHIEDAKWIAENCMPGTMVDLFHNDKRYPYIKEIIFGETYSVDSGLTHGQYMGIAEKEGELGYSSKGEDVAALQRRLIELGLYDGTADGYYSPQMVRTVKALQKLLGMLPTGIADAELIAAVNTSSCPVSSIRTLSEGSSGEPVMALQQILAALGIYTSQPSGNYDAGTREAVAAFQQMKGYMADGVATPAIQQEMLSEAESLAHRFGEEGYTLVYDEMLQTIGTVTSKSRLNVRAEDGSIIGGLEPRTRVNVLQVGKDRALVTYENGKQGYVSTAYLNIKEEIIQIPTYERAANPASALPRFELSNFAQTQAVSRGTNNINNNLRARSAPDTESEIVFLMTPGDTCYVLSLTDNGWAHIRFGNRTGYAMAKYLDIVNTVEITGEFAYKAS